MRTIVIYHGGGCADGFCAAWLFSKAYPGAEFMPMNYGDPVPDVYCARVFLLDFSWKRAEMVKLIEKATQVTVIDHHQTAEAELAGLAADPKWSSNPTPPEIIFDMNHSGAWLAYEWLVKNIPNYTMKFALLGTTPPLLVPDLVKYVEDRDLWRFAMPNSREVNAALRTYPHEFPEWDRINIEMQSGGSRGRFISEGAGILRAEAAVVASHVKHAREVQIGGHIVLAVNATTLMSEIAGELAAGRPFGACWFDRPEPNGTLKRVWSLRVRDGDFDVSAVAARYGGGGHKRAAGFQQAAGYIAPSMNGIGGTS